MTGILPKGGIPVSFLFVILRVNLLYKSQYEWQEILFPVIRCEESSLREGFFSRRSNLKTLAISLRFNIPAYAGMTTILLGSVNGNVVEGSFEQISRFRFTSVEMTIK